MDYKQLIEQFVFGAIPSAPVSKAARFEAVMEAVYGTKQRRYGPMPSPESQVVVRDTVRAQLDRANQLEFMLPWGSSKQRTGAPGIDVLELMAVKQLGCLSRELLRYGVGSRFVIRIDDHTDRFLFGDDRLGQIATYAKQMRYLLQNAEVDAITTAESSVVEWGQFAETATAAVPKFYQVLRGDMPAETLADVGWKGVIPPEQQDYYYDWFRLIYPGEDHRMHLARYFSSTLARAKHGATQLAGVQISFNHPVPGTPQKNPRLFYRTVPERYTNKHQAPWQGEGYLEISGDNAVTPRFVGPDVQARLIPNEVSMGGYRIQVPYLLT